MKKLLTIVGVIVAVGVSIDSQSTRYEAAWPFCVMRTGRCVSRTRPIYVERLLRHSENGTTSSDGRQRRMGVSRTFGISSSPPSQLNGRNIGYFARRMRRVGRLSPKQYRNLTWRRVFTSPSGGFSLCRNHVEQVEHVELSACSCMICMVNQVWKIRKVQEQ